MNKDLPPQDWGFLIYSRIYWDNKEMKVLEFGLKNLSMYLRKQMHPKWYWKVLASWHPSIASPFWNSEHSLMVKKYGFMS